MQVTTTEVDCPQCRGAGTAVVYKERDTGQALGIECPHCGLEQTYDEPPDDEDADSDTLQQQPLARVNERPFPQHLGAGWYRLSSGRKVRGKDKATSLQATLSPPSATTAPPDPDPDDTADDVPPELVDTTEDDENTVSVG